MAMTSAQLTILMTSNPEEFGNPGKELLEPTLLIFAGKKALLFKVPVQPIIEWMRNMQNLLTLSLYLSGPFRYFTFPFVQVWESSTERSRLDW